MSTPMNRELYELRTAKEHYIRILKNDDEIKSLGNPDNLKILSDEDIAKINKKIDGISEKINDLLEHDEEYAEVA